MPDLLAACARQEPAAQRALYERFAGLLFAICRRYSPDRMAVEDMHQIAFVRIFSSIKTCRANTLPELEAWLRRVTANSCLNELAKSKKAKRWLNDVPAAMPEAVAPGEPQLGHLDAEALQALVDGLPEGARIIFNLFAIEGYSHAEIAASLGIAEGTSRTQLTRARHLLRQALARAERNQSTTAKTI